MWLKPAYAIIKKEPSRRDSAKTFDWELEKPAVVCSGLGPNRAIRRKSVFIRISQLGCEKRRENLPRLFRNQQVAGSIPAGGSSYLA
jgi:hypothetical protein